MARVGNRMQEELRRKLAVENDDELRRMVESPQYTHWAQLLAVELLAERGQHVTLPPPAPSEPERHFPWRKLLVLLALVLGTCATIGAYFGYCSYRASTLTKPVRQFAERLRAVAATLPAPSPAAGASDPSQSASDTFNAACARPMAKIDWKDVVGFVTTSSGPPSGVAGLEDMVPASWTLVKARRSRQPSAVDNLDLDNVGHYVGASDNGDDDWGSHLPKPEELASFHYAAFSRVSNVVWPQITKAVNVPGEAQQVWVGRATPVNIEGELGRATVDITIVALDTKTVVCSGRLENVGPTGFIALGSGRDDREAARDALSDANVARFASVGLDRALREAWLRALCPTPWPDVCPSDG